MAKAVKYYTKENTRAQEMAHTEAIGYLIKEYRDVYDKFLLEELFPAAALNKFLTMFRKQYTATYLEALKRHEQG